MAILFNNTEAVRLLVLAVGTDAAAQQAVFDSIADNVAATILFIASLGGNLAENLASSTAAAAASGSSLGSTTEGRANNEVCSLTGFLINQL